MSESEKLQADISILKKIRVFAINEATSLNERGSLNEVFDSLEDKMREMEIQVIRLQRKEDIRI